MCMWGGGGDVPHGHVLGLVHGQVALGSRSGRSLGLAPRLRERTPVARKILHLSCFTPSACTRRRRARRARRCGLAFGARALDSGSVLGARARARTRTRGSRSTARLGDAIATIQWPCVLSVFSSLRWAIGGLVLYALHAVGPRVGRADAVDGEPTAIPARSTGHRCPPLGPSEGDVNEKLEKTEEEIGQTEAVEKKGEMLQEEVIAR